MKIMSLDASSKSTGVAIFDDNKLIHYECITATSTDTIKRIQKMTDGINELLNKYSVS